MLNKCLLIGHVGQQPELGETNAGTPYAKFSLATTERWRDKDSGERRERTDWHNVVVWNKGLIEIARKYVRKGSKLWVSGKLETRSWETDNGVKHYITEVVLKAFDGEITLLDKRDGVPPPQESEGGEY